MQKRKDIEMKIIKGIYADAKVFTTNHKQTGLEPYAEAQLQLLCDNKAAEGCKIRVMPDVHPGKVGTIGLTMTVGKRILPNLVGADIGCGITMIKLKQKKAEYQKLDCVIRDHIPAGFAIRRNAHRYGNQIDLTQLCCYPSIRTEKALCSLGTLGSGNHFIELDTDEAGAIYLVVHSGSRHLGQEVTEHYLRKGQDCLKKQGETVPYELTWLEGDLMQQYLHDLQVVQKFAAWNREAILDEIIKGMKWKLTDRFSCIHNYVEENDNELILRKGAIAAGKGDCVIIPVNMRDGILVGKGKGNPDWNQSAPHGAGRILKREDVKGNYTVSQYKKEMQGIYSSCIGADTLDEAPFSYRRISEIQEVIGDTVTVETILHPLYNYKAGGKA